MLFGAASVDAQGAVCLVGDLWPDGCTGTAAQLLPELARAARAVKGRQHTRVYALDLCAVYRALRAAGVQLGADQLTPGPHGVGRIYAGPRAQLCACAPLLPAAVLDELAPDNAGALYQAICEAQRALASCGAELRGSLTAAAVDLVVGQAPRWGWPEPLGGPISAAAYEAIHGGLCEIWHDAEALALSDAADLPVDWIGTPERLPEGWTLRDEDRVSAYAAEACGDLPSVHGPAYADADAPGGALVLADIDLDGWQGVALPVRVDAGGQTVHIAARAGKWRGWFTSDVIRYSRARGADVSVIQAYGWKHAAPYLAPGMRQLAAAKAQHARGSTARAVLSACLQRVVGGLARRDPAELIVDAAQLDQMDSAQLAAAGYVGKLGTLDGWTLVRRAAAPDVPRGTCPVWTAFVVSRAWVSLCERIEAVRAVGGLPLYADTDGLLWAAPPGVSLPTGDALGEWSARGLPHWCWVERRKIYARGVGRKITAAASAGIPRADLVWYLDGGGAPVRVQTLREQLARGASTAEKVPVWTQRTERQRRVAIRPQWKAPRKR